VRISFQSVHSLNENVKDVLGNQVDNFGGFAASFLIISSDTDPSESDEDDWDSDWGTEDNFVSPNNKDLLDLFRSPLSTKVPIERKLDEQKLSQTSHLPQLSDEIVEANKKWKECYSNDKNILLQTDVPTKKKLKVHFADSHHIKTIYEIELEDRKGPWMELARDRERFQRRIQDSEKILSSILSNCHRTSIQSRNEQNC